VLEAASGAGPATDVLAETKVLSSAISYPRWFATTLFPRPPSKESQLKWVCPNAHRATDGLVQHSSRPRSVAKPDATGAVSDFLWRSSAALTVGLDPHAGQPEITGRVALFHPSQHHPTAPHTSPSMAATAIAAQSRLRPLVYHVPRLSFILANPHSQPRCFPRTPRTPRPRRVPLSTSMFSTATPPSAPTTSQQPLARGTQVTSPSGRCYVIDEVIYQRSRGRRLCCLYRAR
jgi:hypothetical protein